MLKRYFFLLLLLVIIPTISSMNIDNLKGNLIIDETTSQYGKIDIYNWNIIGKLFDIKTATLELKENSDICNSDCSADIEIIMYQEGVLIDDIIFVGGEVDSYEFYIDDKVYNLGDEVKVGTYQVRLEGKKNIFETVDWQITSQGKLIDEWVFWASGLNEDLLHYFKFDETAGTNIEDEIRDSAGGTNGSFTNTTRLVVGNDGVVGKSLNITDNEFTSGGINISNEARYDTLLGGDSNFTISVWVKNTDDCASSGEVGFFSKGNNVWGNGFLGIQYTASKRPSLYFEGDGGAGERRSIFTDNYTCVKNVWQHWAFVYNGSGGADIYINGTSYDVNTTGVFNSYSNNFPLSFGMGVFGIGTGNTYQGYLDELGIWNRTLTADEVNNLWNNGVGASQTNLEVTLISPIDNFIDNFQTISFNCSATDDEEVSNLTLYLNGGKNFTKAGIGGSSLELFKTLTVNPIENQTWTCLAKNPSNIFVWAETNQTFNISDIAIKSQTFNSSTFETKRETFTINISSNASLTAVNLIFNGTSRATTKSGNLWSSTIDIPNITGNIPFLWNFTFGGEIISSVNNSVTSNLANFSLCETNFNSTYLNFIFKDEGNSSFIDDATIPSSTFVYYLGSGAFTKTLLFVNNTGASSYGFCSSPSNEPINVDINLQYKDKSNDYPQRIYNPTTLVLSNTTRNQTLFLLLSADGQYVTFQVANTAEQPISNTVVKGTRAIEGTTTEVASGTTDATGTVTFFLNPNFPHIFNFSATGFPEFITTITPTQSSYTITLGSSTAGASTDFSKGISYVIRPKANELKNNTDYDFNYTLTSSFWDVSEFGFVLQLSNGTVLGSVNSNSNGGIVNLNQNTINNSNIVMNSYYVIDGNFTNQTRVWIVYNTEFTQWSISNFFTDLNTYLTAGIFGLDNFGLHLIVYLIIFISVGIMSFKYGLTSPIAISTIVFGVIYFFDVVIGLLPNPVNAITNFPTIAAAIILVVLIFKEVKR